MIGQKFIQLDSVDSTNNYAAKLLSEGKLAHGTVILADNQTDGKGQRGNKWHVSNEKQFICSVFLETAFLSVERYWYLNLVVTLAVRETIAHFLAEQPCIKWPNDILVNNRKMAGILIETNWNAGKIISAVVGVGINIHEESGVERSISLADFTHQLPQPFEMGTRFASALEWQFEQLRKGEWNQLMQEYLRHLWMLNELTDVTINGERTSGFIRGLNENGGLLFEIEGEMNAYDIKEITFRY